MESRFNKGTELVLKERQKQIDKGYTPEHDDHFYSRIARNMPLIEAAKAYLKAAENPNVYTGKYLVIPSEWPFDEKYWKPESTNIKNLVKVAALVMSEIDRRLEKGENP